MLPQYELDVRDVSLNFASLRVGRFDVRKRPKVSAPLIFIKEGRAFFSFSFWRLPKGVLSCFLKGDIKLGWFYGQGVMLRNVWVGVVNLDPTNRLAVDIRIDEASQGKKVIGRIQGQGSLDSGKFVLDGLRGSICGGTLEAKGEGVFLGPQPKVRVRLDFKGIRMQELVKELEIEKRVHLTGVFSGPVDLSFGARGLEDLSGSLDSEGGGRLGIDDNGALNQNLQKVQGGNIVVENLENYDYDIGKVILSKEEESPVADIVLKGAGGTRRLITRFTLLENKAF